MRQAAKEKAWFAEKFAGADPEIADRLGCPSVVHRIHAMYLDHIHRDWVPKTFQLLEEEMEKAESESARLGMPALHDRTKMDETRQAVCSRATEVVENGASELVLGCRSAVVAALGEKLKRAVTPAQGIKPEGLEGWHRLCLGNVTRICTEGLEEMVRFYEDGLSQLLRRDDVTVGASRKRKAGAREEGDVNFRLNWRFPHFVNALMRRFKQLLQDMLVKMVDMAEKLLESYFGSPENLIGSPSFRIKANIGGDDTTFEVKCHKPEKVFDNVINAFVKHGDLRALSLTQNVHEVAMGIANWVESCVEARNVLEVKKERIRRAQEGIGEVLIEFGLERSEIEAGSDCIRTLAWAPDRQHVALGGVGLCILRVDDSHRRVDEGACLVSSVAFSPDGATIIYGTFHGALCVVDSKSFVSVSSNRNAHAGPSQEAYPGLVTSLAFHPDGSMLATASNDKTVKLWDTRTWTLLQSLDGHEKAVRSVAFSPDGNHLASGSWDATIKLWSSEGSRPWECTSTLKSSGQINTVTFSPDGTFLASGGTSGSLLWRVSDGGLLHRLRSNVSCFDSVAFSPDGKLLARGFENGDLALWSMESMRPVGAPFQATTDGSGVEDLAFRDSKTMAIVSSGKTVVMWDVSRRAASVGNAPSAAAASAPAQSKRPRA